VCPKPFGDRTFPDFEFRWSAEKGAAQLCRQFQELGLSHDDLTDKRFTRLKWLRYLLDTQKLDGALRWTSPVETQIATGAEERT